MTNNDEENKPTGEALLYKESEEYLTKNKQYEDVKSTAVIFIFLAILGIAFQILVLSGIINLTLKTTIHIILAIVYVVFLIIGIISLLKIKDLKSEAKTEADFSDNVIEKFLKEYPADKIDSGLDLTIGDELLYFERSTKISEILSMEYPDVDSDYLDTLVDQIFEKLYK